MTAKAAHIAWLIGILVVSILVIFSFHSWLAEHDARLQADQTVKVNEQAILRLEDQLVALQNAAAVKKAAVVRQVAAIKTAPQALIAIPSLTQAPLNTRQAVDNPAQVSVDAVVLAQALGSCNEAQIDLDACQKTVGIKDQQLTAKDVEIAALKKKRSFWARLKEDGIVGAITFGVGAIL